LRVGDSLIYITDIYNKLIQGFVTPILIREYKKPPYDKINERAVEYSFVFKWLWRCNPKTVLDVGPGKSALPNLIASCGYKVTAIDQMVNYWGNKFYNRHFFVQKDDITNPKLESRFDVITCIGTLEHIKDYDLAISNMFRLLNRKGHLILTFPYNENEYVEEMWGDRRYISQTFCRENVDNWLETNHGIILDQKYYTLHSQGKSIDIIQEVDSCDEHDLTCIIIGAEAI
jgi:SAM-dependent methyltransferase